MQEKQWTVLYMTGIDDRTRHGNITCLSQHGIELLEQSLDRAINLKLPVDSGFRGVSSGIKWGAQLRGPDGRRAATVRLRADVQGPRHPGDSIGVLRAPF